MLKQNDRILGYKTAKLLTEDEFKNVAGGVSDADTGRMTFSTFTQGHADTDYRFDDGTIL